jgi:hypothetical protein
MVGIYNGQIYIFNIFFYSHLQISLHRLNPWPKNRQKSYKDDFYALGGTQAFPGEWSATHQMFYMSAR